MPTENIDLVENRKVREILRDAQGARDMLTSMGFPEEARAVQRLIVSWIGANTTNATMGKDLRAAVAEQNRLQALLRNVMTQLRRSIPDDLRVCFSIDLIEDGLGTEGQPLSARQLRLMAQQLERQAQAMEAGNG